MAAYSYVSWSGVQTQLLARLQDSSAIFFTNTGNFPEIQGYLKEALRTWQVLTAYWREQDTLTTAASTIFYDLTSELSTARPLTIYDQELVAEMQYMLLEPATPTAWSGTEQFVLSDLTNALQRRRDQFLAETGIHLTRSTQAASAGTNTLPATVIDLRRVAWVTAASSYTPITREDEWALQAYNSAWTTSGTPTAYSIAASAPVTLELGPPPSAAGTLEILSVDSGATLDPTTGSGVLMGIPDDYCWVVKWGALADLLSKDGPAYDPSRAAICEQRYRQGVEFARHAVCIVQAQISSSPLIVDSVYAQDMYNPSWQNTTAATPTTLLSAGLNMVATYPPPSGATAITLDVVGNADIPASNAANLQLGPEELEAVLDYAVHLAMFKVGGEEWIATQVLYDNFMVMAKNYVNRIGAMVRYAKPLALQSMKEEVVNKREVNSG